MGVLGKIRKVFVTKIMCISITVLLLNISTLVFANPSGERTVSKVSTLGPATVTSNLTMFSEATIVGNVIPSGTISGVTLMTFSHNRTDYNPEVYWMLGTYLIKDTLHGEYAITNVRATVTNSSSATTTVRLGGNKVEVEIDDYVADDSSRQAVVEVIGDITYKPKIDDIGTGTVEVENIIRGASGSPVQVLLNSPIEVANAIVLTTQPLSFGNVIPLTGDYEKESAIDIVGARGTEVTIGIDGTIGQEVNDELARGTHRIPITYRIENGTGAMISGLTLGTTGAGSAILKGIINSDNIPKGQAGGSYTGTVTIEVDYK